MTSNCTKPKRNFWNFLKSFRDCMTWYEYFEDFLEAMIPGPTDCITGWAMFDPNSDVNPKEQIMDYVVDQVDSGSELIIDIGSGRGLLCSKLSKKFDGEIIGFELREDVLSYSNITYGKKNVTFLKHNLTEDILRRNVDAYISLSCVGCDIPTELRHRLFTNVFTSLKKGGKFQMYDHYAHQPKGLQPLYRLSLFLFTVLMEKPPYIEEDVKSLSENGFQVEIKDLSHLVIDPEMRVLSLPYVKELCRTNEYPWYVAIYMWLQFQNIKLLRKFNMIKYVQFDCFKP